MRDEQTRKLGKLGLNGGKYKSPKTKAQKRKEEQDLLMSFVGSP